MVQMVKNLPVIQEMWVRSLDQEDPLEKGKATHSSILAWRIPRTEEPGGLQSRGSQRGKTEQLTGSLFTFLRPGKVIFKTDFPWLHLTGVETEQTVALH